METKHKIALIEAIRDAVLIHLEDASQISAERLQQIVQRKSDTLIGTLKHEAMNKGSH